VKKMLFGAIYTPEQIENFNIVDGLTPSLIAILIVFAVLVIIILCVNLLKLVNKKETIEEELVEASKKAFTAEDITDEDMMAAALVATIDYASETKKDVRLVSIRQIS